MFCFMRESNADYRVSFVITPFRKAASVFRRFAILTVEPFADESVASLIKEQAEMLAFACGKGLRDRFFDLLPYS